MADIWIIKRRGRSLIEGKTNTGLRWLANNMTVDPPYYIDTELVEDYIEHLEKEQIFVEII